MRPESVIDLMHDVLHTIQRDVAALERAAFKDAVRRPINFGDFNDGIRLAAHAAGVHKKIDLLLAELEPLAAEHIVQSARQECERVN